MSLTRSAIEKDRVTFVLLGLLAVAGMSAFRSLPQAEDPSFPIRTAVVQTVFPGASPSRVEELITDPLERAIVELPELDTVRSQSKTGVSVVYVDVQDRYDDLRPIWDSLRRKVEAARSDLPDGVIGPIVNDEFGDVFGTVVTVSGEGASWSRLADIADRVRDELLLIPDVAKVAIYGEQEERIFVDFDNSRLAEIGLSPIQLRNLLEARNIVLAGGEIRTEEERIVLEPSGSFESLDELRDAIVSVPGRSDLLRLGDLARIRRGYVDPQRVETHASGARALALAVSLREGGNILVLGDAARAAVDRLRGELPIEIDLDFVLFQADAVRSKVGSFVGNLVQAVVIVVLVMLLSLGLRTGLVVASLIPMSILAAFLVMSIFGIGIDQMSLASLIIALGMLVDNAIVMSESILVQMQAGRKAVEAAVASAAELKIPLLTSSLTTAAAFLPIYLAESTTGEYTAPLFKVVTITLLCSWVLSLTMVPLLCVRFLRPAPRDADEAFDTRFYRAYRNSLAALLRRPGLSITLVSLVFLASLQLFRLVPVIFMPPHDRPSLTAELRLPVGTPLTRTLQVVGEFEAKLAELRVPDDARQGETSGLTSWVTFAGEGAPRFVLSAPTEQRTPEYAIVIANATDRPYVDRAVSELRAFAEERFPGLSATIRPLQNGAPIASPIEVRLSGRDVDAVFERVDTVRNRLRAMPGVASVSDDWGARSKKLVVRVDPTRARLAGVTNQDVAISLQTALSGIETTDLREESESVPVVLRSVEAEAPDYSKIDGLAVFSQLTGRSVPLLQIADLEVEWQAANIRRRNRLPTVTVQADLEPGTTAAEVAAPLAAWLDEESAGWPTGSGWELGGETESSGQASASIADKLPIAGLLIVLLLVGQFNSIRRTAIVLITIPLGLIGVVVGLVVMRSYFGFMTLLGVISLAGIVINNAIVLLDRIEIEIRDNGLEPARAVLESAQRRLRPILLTTATTLGGLIPLYLGGGPMWEPMAVAIMFGLVFATILTLGVVPVLYVLFFRVRVGAEAP